MSYVWICAISRCSPSSSLTLGYIYQHSWKLFSSLICISYVWICAISRCSPSSLLTLGYIYQHCWKLFSSLICMSNGWICAISRCSPSSSLTLGYIYQHCWKLFSSLICMSYGWICAISRVCSAYIAKILALDNIRKLVKQTLLYLPRNSITYLLTYLLTYLCPSLPVEHRPSTTPRHRTLFWAALVIPDQWSPAVSALLQCLASNCCEAGLSSSSPAGSRSLLGVWCWMLASWGCVRSSPTSSAVSAWPRVPVPLAPTDLHFGSSLAIGFCRCASDRCWRMSGSFIASSVLSAMFHIRKAGLTSHWSWRCGVWFSCWFLQMPRCFWA